MLLNAPTDSQAHDLVSNEVNNGASPVAAATKVAASIMQQAAAAPAPMPTPNLPTGGPSPTPTKKY
jgi:hypothetical protein